MQAKVLIDWPNIPQYELREIFRRLAQLTVPLGRWDGRQLELTMEVKAPENLGRLWVLPSWIKVEVEDDVYD